MSQKGSSVELRDDENCGGTGAMFFSVFSFFCADGYNQDPSFRNRGAHVLREN